MPVTFGGRAVWPRGLCGGIFMIFIIIACVAAMATPLVVKRSVISTVAASDQTTQGAFLARHVDVAPFRACQDFPTAYALGQDECVAATSAYDKWIAPGKECDTFNHYLRSIQAFYMLTLICCGIAFILSTLNAFERVSSWFTFGFVATALFCSFLGWVLAASFVSAEYCGGKLRDDASFSIGPSLFLMLCVFTALLCMLVLLCMMEKSPHDDACCSLCTDASRSLRKSFTDQPPGQQMTYVNPNAPTMYTTTAPTATGPRQTTTDTFDL